jgi:predicted dehydrogenase
MRRNPEAARPFCEANGIPLCTDSVAEVLAVCDIAYVATPPCFHKEYVLQAAAAGKHVMVEKPMGISAAEDEEMIAACTAAGVKLFTAYYRRFHPHAVMMKNLIDSGRIGRPLLAQIDFAVSEKCGFDWTWRLTPSINGGGLFVDVVSHRIDLLFHLLGPLEKAAGFALFKEQSGTEQAVSGSILLQNGTVASVCGDFASGGFRDGFTITGTTGRIHTDRLDGHAFDLITGEKSETFKFDKDPCPHRELIRRIERVLLDGEPEETAGGTGIWTDRALDAILHR